MVDGKERVITEMIATAPDSHCWSLLPDGFVPDVELQAAERELGMPFPPGYRAFLRTFGSGRVGGYELFGLPRNDLWGDLVLLNELADPPLPPGHVRFGRDRWGRDYCFDTSRRDGEGEYPVVMFGPVVPATTVARCFLDFLRQIIRGELWQEDANPP